MAETIYDRLKKKLEVEKADEGISAIDLAQLPSPLRKIMRMMLREIDMTRVALFEAVSAMPPGDRIEPKELEQALATLTQQNWLICRGEGDRISYSVNLRRKAGSSLNSSFWNALDKKIAESKGPKQE